MPQGRRKVPFSGKAKKKQLQLKKFGNVKEKSKTLLLNDQSADDDDEDVEQVQKLNFQPKASNSRRDFNRYVLQFHKESESELRAKKEDARKELAAISEESLELDPASFFPPELDFPTRPPWNYSMSKEELEARENRYFTEYVKSLESKFEWKDLSYFELNLETWRQLWRVIEIADVVLLIVDARYPGLMFPPSLHRYVTETLNKDMILVLNKIDLIPAPLVIAWKQYFREKYNNLHIVYFTSLPGYNLRTNKNRSGLHTKRRRGRVRMAAEGASKILEACKTIVKNEVDLSSWQEKISEEMNTDYDPEDGPAVSEFVDTEPDTQYVESKRFEGGVLTVGCVGQPNAGKSSLMNALMGTKVVSVSRTPGHTKHFQTIFLTSNVRLCDCPGLVFPSKVPKACQVLMGSFPIAQLREPFSAVRYLAERLDLVSLLKLQHPHGDTTWSALDVCEGWALKRHFYTAKAARLDGFRAANHLLRMALDGKISLYLYPPGYLSSKGVWARAEGVDDVRWVQADSSLPTVPEPPESDLSDSSSRSKSTRLSDSSDDESSQHSDDTIPPNKFTALDSSA